jgi:hypothetical protein
MKHDEKKAAIDAYKKRKAIPGIFAVRCGQKAWVGQTLNLETIQNRIWFSLRVGNNTNPELQSAWSVHGGENFTFEQLERLKDDELPFVRDSLLKERVIHWRSALNGSVI